MQILLLIIMILSSANIGYMLWVTFGFNFQRTEFNEVMTIKDYLSEGGQYHLMIITAILIIIIILFLIYAYKDSKRFEMYNDGHEVTFHKRNNVFSRKRIAQYVFLAFAIIELFRCVNFALSLDPSLKYMEIYFRHVMIFGFDFMAVYFIVFLGSLFYEYHENKGVDYH